MKFHEKLYYLRKKHKLSQGNLAKKIGVSQTAVANYESGLRFPSQETLLILADTFQVSIDYLFDRTSNLSSDISGIHMTLVKALLKNNSVEVTKFFQANIDLGLSFEYLVENIISPALYIVGEMWESGEIDIYQEHIASECLSNALSGLVIRSKTIKEISRILVFTARNEKHDIPARIIDMAIKSWGHESMFMSQVIPLESLIESVNSLNIDTIVISITMEEHLKDLEEDIRKIIQCSQLKNLKVIIGGQSSEFVRTSESHRIILIKNLDLLRSIL